MHALPLDRRGEAEMMYLTFLGILVAFLAIVVVAAEAYRRSLDL